jgi:hypothetical protein
MTEAIQPTIGEIFNNHKLMLDAFRRGVRQALLKHAQAGEPVATWRDERVVWLQPAEVFAMLAETAPTPASPASE